ncbi:DoxX family protein [Fodinicurvata fenggangensis]|uniref:DoxX family protein n=1 Tax=Fodinicurvata fenggangensis TaxID=1121830 RepID=UPI00047D7D5E|nr:DoxX family protein [Fodinicurvata fenggangensis]
MEKDLNAWTPRMLSILRIVTALIFLAHGTQKLLGFPPSESTAAPFTLSWISGTIELFCGALLVVGLFTRPAAFLASGLMAAAYWIAHAPRDVFPVNNGGDAAILYCFIFLYLVFAGPGPWSLDALRRR